MLVIGAVITAVFLILAIFAPWIAPYGFAQYQDADGKFPKLGHPSSQHWFGTTDLQTDVLSRVIWGARTALEVVTLAVFASLILGLVLGTASRATSAAGSTASLVLIMDALFAFPSFLLAIVCAFLFTNIIGDGVFFLHGGVVAAALSLTVIYIPQYFRVVRNTTVSAKEATYIEAARALGATRRGDHAPLPVRQRDPERAGHRHPQRRRRDRHPGRPRLPRHRHPARRGRRVGLRPAARARRRAASASGGRRCTRDWRSSC